MSDWVDSEVFWDAIKSINRLLLCADTEGELFDIEKALHYEIRCIAAAVYENGAIDHIKRD